MQVRVLGCQGGELRGCRSTSLRIDGHTAMDAGLLAGVLTLPRRVRVDGVPLFDDP